LSDRRPKSGRKIRDVDTDFDLFHDAVTMRILVLDWILDRDHVAGTRGHDVIHHRRQGGGLPGTGGTGDQDQALPEPRQAANHEGDAELVKVRDLVRNEPQSQTDGATLLEGINSKSCMALPVEGEIEIAVRLGAYAQELTSFAARALNERLAAVVAARTALDRCRPNSTRAVTQVAFLIETMQRRMAHDMALRIEKAFGIKMDTLMRMQASYDIARTRKREHQIRVRRISRPIDVHA